MTETKTYAGMLYRLADEIEREGLMTVEPETIREAAERLDTQTVTINVVKKQRDELMVALKWAEQVLKDMHAEGVEYDFSIVSDALAGAKGGAACN